MHAASPGAGGSKAAAERDQVERLRAFLQQHARLADCHTNVFFTEQLWKIVPSEWLDTLAAASPSQLSALPSSAAQSDWPPNLRAFVDEALHLSLQSAGRSEHLQPPQPQCRCRTLLERAMFEGMSDKKRHEVERLASLVADVAVRSAADVMVDVGAGQCHLSRVMAFRHSLRVVAIDGVAALTAAATARTQKLCELKRCDTCPALRPPMCVTAAAWTPEELRLAVDEALGPSARPHRILFVCLHACGDLTPTVLRTFLDCADAVAVVAVGCCYNLLTEVGTPQGQERAAAVSIMRHTSHAGLICDDGCDSEVAPAAEAVSEDTEPGFPMSTALAGHTLGRQARMLACQSADRWRDADAALSWRRLAYRAALEAVLLRFAPEARGSPLRLGGTTCGMTTPFAVYARQALSSAGVECPGDADLEEMWAASLQTPAHLMGPFCALRCVLAAPIEALLVLDRVLYLRERLTGQGTAVWWLPVFDARVSPRNIALVALKDGAQ